MINYLLVPLRKPSKANNAKNKHITLVFVEKYK